MKNIFDYLSELDSFKNVINSNKLNIKGSSDGLNQALIASDFYKNDNTIFVILPSLYLAQKYYDMLSNMNISNDVLFFPSDELIDLNLVSVSNDFLYERIETLYTLLNDKNKKIVIMNFYSAIKYEMNKDIWLNSIFDLKTNNDYDIDLIINKLISMGYVKTFQATKTGEFAKRGSIIDIFPLGAINPIRLDFFGDTLDEIKEFDSETQISFNRIDKINIMPVSELIYDNNTYQISRQNILGYIDNYKLSEIEDEIYKKDLFDLENHNNLQMKSKYITFFDNTKTTIFDFRLNKRIYIIDPKKCMLMYDNIKFDIDDYQTRIGGDSFRGIEYNYNFNDILNESNINIEGISSIFDDVYDINSKEIEPYYSNKNAIVKDFNDFKLQKLIVSISDEKRFNKLKELLDDNNIIMKSIYDINNLNSNIVYRIKDEIPSFNLPNEKLFVVNEDTIFNEEIKPKAKYKSIYKNAQKVSKYDELEIGDYVVHYDYGIGIYDGILTIVAEGLKRDCIRVIYKNNASLIVPVEKISSIYKYASKDTEGVEISEMGGTKWQKSKARVRNRIHDISEKLIKLYSSRMKEKGFEYPSDTPEQISFENDFEYELTTDQYNAIKDIKRDMESNKAMDRLVCGDVGYGKTEVALRAAFKAVYGGKQVAVLAPTTILARQHYQTFKKRMENYGVRVELLSRFVSKKDQTKIIADLLKGSVDVVVATHRLLSDEIKFKDLGLLIIDEEQRFGVTHKEKIKELKVNVDCITLTATPIPRTLQMSVMGIKDLSMIETPPKNRYPVQTYVLERNDKIIADAISKEIARGGQVFYLYNFTETIEDVKLKIESLVPEAKVIIGHGKLTKDQLESAITKFIDKKYNVLLCTTIIETGIDMPDTNTLIIHDADRLGLSQMYQIRGRVGRSNKIAYAYLMYEPRKKLTKEAEQRLKTIKEFNELGSGYKIAMRDLSIRGAGDILGEEQSGFIDTIGLDMYLKILNEEINYVPQEKEKIKARALTSRVVDKSYIESDEMRIQIHKRIDKLSSIDDLNNLYNELTDRFGNVSMELNCYMYEKLMLNLADNLGIKKIDRDNSNSLLFLMPEIKSQEIGGIKLFEYLPDDDSIRLISNKDHSIYIRLDYKASEKMHYFRIITKYFTDLLKI